MRKNLKEKMAELKDEPLNVRSGVSLNFKKDRNTKRNESESKSESI